METSKLQKIDESLQLEHSCLDSTDMCYFFGEYSGRQGYSHSDMNQLIFNFKKPMEKKGKAGWHYKEKEIKKIAEMLLATDAWKKLKNYTWIPMPPSKVKSDPGYDDRLSRVLAHMKEVEKNLDVRELLIARSSRDPAHDPNSVKRPKISDHLNNYSLDATLKEPTPRAIAIFDDVITTGASFKAAKEILGKVYPETPIVGIFIARNIVLPA